MNAAENTRPWAQGIDVAASDWPTIAAWLTEVPQPYRGNRAELALHDAMAEIERLRQALSEATLARIEAQNPGIDMDKVRRTRAAATG